MSRLSIVAWALVGVSLPVAAPAGADEYTIALDGTRRNDRFGEVVRVDGDTMVVGAPRRNAAYVFARRNGVWTFVQDLAPRPIHPDRRFGTALAVLGDWIAVGATWTLDTATPGSVYLYRRTATGWALTTRVDDVSMQYGYGDLIRMSTDRLFVRATGTIRIYRRGADDAALETTLALPPDFDEGGVPYEYFEFTSLAVVDGRLLAGVAVRRNVPAPGLAPLVGRVLVYERTGTSWTPTTVLRPDAALSELAQGRFALWMEADETTVFVSTTAPAEADGAIDVYELSASTWARTAQIVVPGGFRAFALDGDVAVVGQPARTGIHPYQGALLVFARHGTTWRQVAGPVAHHDPDPMDELGSAVAITGQELIAGMPSDDRPPTNPDNWDFGSVRVFTNVITGDDDGDGLPTSWELASHLDPFLATGDEGASGDPDLDGVPNVDERAAATHPRGTDRRLLAEGATGSFFDTRLSLFNPGDAPAYALLTFQRDGAAPLQHAVRLPGRTGRTLDADAVAGMASAAFSIAVDADRPLVVDRTMTWDARGYGAHAERALDGPATQWYLAEGSTAGPFVLFYLLQNPHPAQVVDATITYLRPAPQAPVVRTYRLPPLSRTTIAVNQEPGVESTDVSASIAATAPITVERAMYLADPLRPFTAGHASAGQSAAATSWFLAEGATGAFFDLFVLVANPDSRPAPIAVTYLLPDGNTLTKTYEVGPRSRFTIYVDAERFGGAPLLANAAVSTRVVSTAGVPIVVERAMWWPDGRWHEAHNSAGATGTATRWGLAGGEDGGPRDAQTYLLVANTSSFAGEVAVRLFFEDGVSVERVYSVPATSRTNVPIGIDFPLARHARFSLVVESRGTPAALVVVERSMYFDAEGLVWAAGTNALATPLP